jgi:oxygen-independent coproporphyrinogen-3 oxidase
MININKNLLKKYNVATPRYTSYPPANFFENQNQEKYIEAIENSNSN